MRQWLVAVVAGALLFLAALPLRCAWEVNGLMRGVLHAATPPPAVACAATPPIVRAVGTGWWRVGDLAAARPLLEHARTLDPAHEAVLALLADLYTAVGESEAALDALADAGAVRSLRERADVAQRAGDEAAAEAALHTLLRVDPEPAWAYVRLAELARARGDLAATERLVTEGLARQPDALWLWVALGSLREAQGQLAEAEAAYERAAALDTRHGTPALTLARLTLARGALDEAEHWLAEASVYRPTDPAITQLAEAVAAQRATGGQAP